MVLRTDQERSSAGPRRARVVLAAPLLLIAGDPDLHVPVNHELPAGYRVFGWGLDPSGSRVIYGVNGVGFDFTARQIFSASADGSQDVLTLTDPLPASRSISIWGIAPAGGRIVLVSDVETDERFELYSTPTDGSRVLVKLSTPLPPGQDVLDVAFTPDGARVLFLTGVPFSGQNTLNSAPLDGSAPAVVLHSPEPGTYGFLAFRANADGGRVLYWSRPERLLSAPSDGSAPALTLSPSPWDLEPDVAYVLSPDGKWIVYFSATPAGSDVFSAKVDGSAPSRALFFQRGPGEATELDSSTPLAFQVTPDSRHVVGIASGGSELRVAPIDGSAPPTVLADPEVVDRRFFRVGSDGRIVFQAHLGSRGRGIFTVPMDGSARAVQIHGQRGDALPLKHEVTDKGDVVFDGLLSGSGRLFTVPADGSARARQLHPPMVAGGDVQGANSVNGRSFLLGPDHAYLLYVADQERNDVRELFAVAPDGDPAVRKMNGPLAADADVVSYAFAPDSRRVLYGVWSSTARDVFTSVIPEEGAGARAPRVAGGSARALQRDGLGLVEDPGRAQRELATRRPEDAPVRRPSSAQRQLGGRGLAPPGVVRDDG